MSVFTDDLVFRPRSHMSFMLHNVYCMHFVSGFIYTVCVYYECSRRLNNLNILSYKLYGYRIFGIIWITALLVVVLLWAWHSLFLTLEKGQWQIRVLMLKKIFQKLTLKHEILRYVIFLFKLISYGFEKKKKKV